MSAVSPFQLRTTEGLDPSAASAVLGAASWMVDQVDAAAGSPVPGERLMMARISSTARNVPAHLIGAVDAPLPACVRVGICERFQAELDTTFNNVVYFAGPDAGWLTIDALTASMMGSGLSRPGTASASHE